MNIFCVATNIAQYSSLQKKVQEVMSPNNQFPWARIQGKYRTCTIFQLCRVRNPSKCLNGLYHNPSLPPERCQMPPQNTFWVYTSSHEQEPNFSDCSNYWWEGKCVLLTVKITPCFVPIFARSNLSNKQITCVSEITREAVISSTW